jgi:hypothetical protein
MYVFYFIPLNIHLFKLHLYIHVVGIDIDASYQVSVHLAEGFQRRRLKCEKLTDDRNKRKTSVLVHECSPAYLKYSQPYNRKHLWKVLYNDWSFCPDPLTNMAATGNSSFWLTNFKKMNVLQPIWNTVNPTSVWKKSNQKLLVLTLSMLKVKGKIHLGIDTKYYVVQF